VDAHVTSGPDHGEDVTFEVRSTQIEVPTLHVGDRP
jgi:hypothetical protein